MGRREPAARGPLSPPIWSASLTLITGLRARRGAPGTPEIAQKPRLRLRGRPDIPGGQVHLHPPSAPPHLETPQRPLPPRGPLARLGAPAVPRGRAPPQPAAGVGGRGAGLSLPHTAGRRWGDRASISRPGRGCPAEPGTPRPRARARPPTPPDWSVYLASLSMFAANRVNRLIAAGSETRFPGRRKHVTTPGPEGITTGGWQVRSPPRARPLGAEHPKPTSRGLN